MNLLITLAAYALLMFLIAVAIHSGKRKADSPFFEVHERLFLVAFLACLLLFRLPFLTANVEVNVDEGAMLAQGMRYLTDPMPWRSADGTTSGPLNMYVLMWPALFNMPMNYCTAHLTGVVLIALSVFFLLRLLRLMIGSRWSLVLLMPSITLYLLTVSPDWIHYSSECLPVAFLCALGWCGFALIQRPSISRAAGVGLITGAIPLAKLQAVPIAAAMFMIPLVTLLVRARKERAWHEVLRPVSAAVLCLFVVPLLVLLPVFLSGVWPDFWIRYIVRNLSYGAQTNRSHLETLAKMLCRAPLAAAFFTGMIACTATALIMLCRAGNRRRLPTGYFGLVFAALLLVGTALFSVFKSNYAFPHYLHFLVFPFTILLTVLLVPFRRAANDTESKGAWNQLTIAQAAAICLVPLFAIDALYGFTLKVKLRSMKPLPDSEIVRFLKRHQIRGDQLAIWGWTPSLYVLSGMTPATRDVIYNTVLESGPINTYYKLTFLEDVERSRPRFFLDTLRANFWHEWLPYEVISAANDPYIGKYLKNQYVETCVMNDRQGNPEIVVYERKPSLIMGNR